MRTQLCTHLRTLVIVPIMLCAAMLTPRAQAQVEPIEPVWMVAARDTPLRCGELSTFYEVATLKRGQVVRMNGRSSRWARVVYPEGLYGFVRKEDAREVNLDADSTGTLLVTEISSIKAPNRISGLTGSWRSIYLGDLKPDTPIEIIGEALSKDGQMVGYRVKPLQPPAVDHPPQGFVQLAALRIATEDEVDAHRAILRKAEGVPDTTENQEVPEAGVPASGSQDTTPAGEGDSDSVPPEQVNAADRAETGDEPDPADTNRPEPQRSESAPSGSGQAQSGQDSSGRASDDQSSDAGSTDDPQPAQADDSLLDEMAIPTADDLDAVSAEQREQPDQPQPTPDAPEPQGAVTAPATSPPAAVSPEKRDYLLWEELESTLTRVRRAGGATLMDSIDELIAEYERSLVNSDTPTVRAALGNRLDWLRMRKTARDQRLALQAAIRDATQISVDARREQELWRSTRGYDIVGRLVPSAIYDGSNLPRMFRVVVEGEAGITRTIGYVRDDATLNIGQLVGSIVGVAGTARYDDALRLRIISPTAVNRFRPEATP